MSQIIVVGGGLAGLSAAHTVLENGGRVLLIEKNPFLGGNSTKATSGINGALTKTQIKLDVKVCGSFCLTHFGSGTNPSSYYVPRPGSLPTQAIHTSLPGGVIYDFSWRSEPVLTV